MEYIDGIKLKTYIIEKEEDEEIIKDILARLGKIIKKLHDNNIIHGDLTTSNMILK